MTDSAGTPADPLRASLPDACGRTPLAWAILYYLLVARPTLDQLRWVSRS